MSALLPTVAVSVFATCGSPPEANTAAEVSAVRQRFANWVAAEKRRDLDASMSFLALDAVIQGEGAPALQGREAARGVWKAFFEIPYTDIVDVAPRTVVVSDAGDLAYDVGNWKIVLPGNPSPTEERGKSTIIWQKQGGEWMAVAFSFSMDAPPEQPSPPARTPKS